MVMMSADLVNLSVHGWIRENYNDEFLEDIIRIIYEYYLIRIDSKILETNEQISLTNLLFDRLQKEKKNENIKDLNLDLLFRASEHDFKAAEFHNKCTDKGP